MMKDRKKDRRGYTPLQVWVAACHLVIKIISLLNHSREIELYSKILHILNINRV